MGKASRRRKDGAATTDSSRRTKSAQVPFVRRPFEGLTGETDWVALREIVPAATATVHVREGATDGDATQATVATVLPLAWPGLRRASGEILIGAQSLSSSGDASRDLAAQLLAAAAVEPGTPVPAVPSPTADSPRLQDLLTDAPLEVVLHQGFEFWVEDQDLDGDAKASLERANESLVPTIKLAALPSAYWCRIGERTHIRLVLPDDEDAATDALARLWAAETSGLGGDTRLLGAFRAGGLLIPVWDLDPAAEADAYEEPLSQWHGRYADALASSEPLSSEERRARSGFLSRQVTLR